MTFQICSADPFVVVLLLGGFDSFPSPSPSHRDGNFVLQGWEFQRKWKGRRWLRECWFPFVWKLSGTNLALREI